MGKVKYVKFICLIFTFVIMVFCYFLAGPMKKDKKELSISHAAWIGYTAEDAINKAATIVHGFVVDKSETRVHEGYTSDGQLVQEFYREVTIRVVDTIKGEDVGFVIYLEMGGETDTHIYQVDGYPYVDSSDEVILLLDDIGALLHPNALLKVKDGTVTPLGLMWHGNTNMNKSDWSTVERSLEELYIVAGEELADIVSSRASSSDAEYAAVPVDMFLNILSSECDRSVTIVTKEE